MLPTWAKSRPFEGARKGARKEASWHRGARDEGGRRQELRGPGHVGLGADLEPSPPSLQ